MKDIRRNTCLANSKEWIVVKTSIYRKTRIKNIGERVPVKIPSSASKQNCLGADDGFLIETRSLCFVPCFSYKNVIKSNLNYTYLILKL